MERFYPREKLEQVVQNLAKIGPASIQALMKEWSISTEVVMDLVKLALFDIILYIDDSGSIEFEEKGIRLEQLKEILALVATAASKFDQDGISVRFMNSNVQGDNIRSRADVDGLVARVRFQGLTPMGTNLRHKVVEPMVVAPARANRLQKPALIITITDGQPAGEANGCVGETIRYAIDELSRTPYGRGGVSFQFTQVGNDLHAREFLSKLDEDPNIGAFVDCTSNVEVEQDKWSRATPPVYLTRELWCAKVMLGAIDSSYDMKDEKASGLAGGGPPGQYGNYSQGGYNQKLAQGGYTPSQAGYSQGQAGYSQGQVGYSQGQAGYLPGQAGYSQTQGGYSQSQGQYPAGQGVYAQNQGYPAQQTYGKPSYGQQPPGYGQQSSQGYGAPYAGYSQPPTSQPPYGQSAQGGYQPQQQPYGSAPPGRRY